MNRAQARAAVDDAFADGVKHLFGVLVASLIAGMPIDPDDAVSRFASGVRKHRDAHARAVAELETIFPE